MEINKEANEKSINESSLTLMEMIEKSKTEPAPEIIWRGITKGSFGFIYGPSKSGKTVFCENLAIKLAIGSEEYMGEGLIGKPQKVLIVSLEEFWISRARRNIKQIEGFDGDTITLLNKNLQTAPTDFLRYIDYEKDWNRLTGLIQESKPDIVIVDSLTRMASNIEESDSAKGVAQRLRDITYDLGITIIVVHHSTKIGDKPISRDDMAGSRVLAQEADFAIAITRTALNDRYIKNIFFRYADDFSETVTAFEIDSNLWLKPKGELNERMLYKKLDGRVDTSNTDIIYNFIKENSCTTSAELEKVFVSSDTMSRKTVFNNLNKLQKQNLVLKQNGNYCVLQ